MWSFSEIYFNTLNVYYNFSYVFLNSTSLWKLLEYHSNSTQLTYRNNLISFNTNFFFLKLNNTLTMHNTLGTFKLILYWISFNINSTKYKVLVLKRIVRPSIRDLIHIKKSYKLILIYFTKIHSLTRPSIKKMV